MRLNLNQLCVFYLAARHKSMTAAAKALYVSPPAVTMQIKKMETWFGFPLFERGQGALRLTERGLALHDLVEPFFRHLDELERSIEELTRAEEGALRLGTHHLPANYFMPDILVRAQTRYPKLKAQMELGTQDKLLEKLVLQQLDLALIIGEPPPHIKCRLAHLFDEEWILVTAAGSDLAEIDAISLKDIALIPLVLQQRGTGALQTVQDYLASHGARPTILLDNISSDVIMQLLPKIRAGAFIGRFMVQKGLNEGIFHEIVVREGPPVFRFQLAYADVLNIPLKIKQFIEISQGFSPAMLPK